MKAKLWKRFLSYVIDFSLISIFVSIVQFLLQNDTLRVLQLKESALFDSILEGGISFLPLFPDYFQLMYEMDKALIMPHIIEAFLIAIYFIFVPLYCQGQTVGQKLLKIMTVTEEQQLPNFNQFLIRTICLQGFGSLLFSLICIYIIPSSIYYGIISGLMLAEFVLLIVSAVILLREEGQRGLQDIWSHTMVIERRV